MNTTEYTPAQLDFLSRFFGPGNLLRWDAYTGGEMSTASRDLLDPLIADFLSDDGSVLLPRVSELEPTTVDWYAMARNARQSRALREQLAAFVGPTHTDFTGQHTSLDDADSVEQAVSELFSPFVYRLRVVKHEDRNHVRDQVFLLRSLRKRRSSPEASLSRPVGRLLRDLEMAIVVRNEESAWKCLEDLRARGRLSAHNLTFLKVRILSHFHRWADILALPEWQSLVAIRRPSRITQALVHAVYATHFSEFETAANVTECVKRFQELRGSFGTIFRARGGLVDPVTLKAFLLRTVSERQIRLESVDAIIRDFPDSHESQLWVESLSAFARAQAESGATTEVVTDPLEAVRAACELGDFDCAFSLLLDCEPSVAVIRQLLACSIEIDTLNAARRTLDFIDNSPDAMRDAALSMRAFSQIWDELTRDVAPVETTPSAAEIPDGWIAWIERVNEERPWPAGAEIASRGSVEWRIDELVNDPDSVRRFAGLLVSTRSPDGDTALKHSLPELLKSILPEDGPVREFKPIYLNLAYILALDTAIGHDDLTALANLAEAILECALSTDAQSNEFEDLLETLEAAWNHVAAPRHLDWALNVLDILIAFNVKQHAPVDRFFLQVTNGFREWSRRIRVDQWVMIEQLARDIGLADTLTGIQPDHDDSAGTAQSLADRLAGQTVAIYTLTERIGRRAADIISSQFHDVRIQLAHDKVASDRLEQLSRNADVFIVNTWDAKHAATNAIQANRPESSVTLRPQSKSAGGVVRAIYKYIETTTVE